MERVCVTHSILWMEENMKFIEELCIRLAVGFTVGTVAVIIILVIERAAK